MVLEHPVHLMQKIDRTQLLRIIEEFGLEKIGNNSKLVFDLYTSINEETDDDEKNAKLVMYNEFLLNMLKHSNNREVLTFEISFGEFSPLASRARLFNHLGLDINNFYFNKILDATILSNEYKMIYRNLELQENPNRINKIELVYGRIAEYKANDKISGEPISETHYEYVWIEIDVKNHKLRLIISSNKPNHIEDTGSRAKIVKKFIPLLRSDYVFDVDESINESHTLFLIYKSLTESIEAEYYSKIDNDTKDEISDLVERAKARLNISNQQDIGLCERIEKLFERNIIKIDFDNFIKKEVRDGRVLKVGFTDAVGGSVKANSGGKRISEDQEIIFDLQNSDVYFDIKETIKKEKNLQSITISWVNEHVVPDDDRFSNIMVKYTAFEGFYSTHFLKVNVRKEIYDFVLPKFEEFKRRETNGVFR